MTDDTILPFWFPAVRGKKLTAGFDGGRLSSDGGVMLLAQAARRMRIAEKLAAVIPDPRDPTRVVHPLPEILLARILAIACGYEDADDLDSLRTDPAFKLACGRLPESGADLMSQPTVSRCENAPGLRDLESLAHIIKRKSRDPLGSPVLEFPVITETAMYGAIVLFLIAAFLGLQTPPAAAQGATNR